MSDPVDALLPGGADVPFDGIEAAQIRLGAADPRHTSQALVATVVVVAARERLPEAAAALDELAEPSGVRAILISHGGTAASPRVRVSARSILVDGLKTGHLNNAVAALRLSSLPTLVWWRGGSPHVLDGLARLADRLVLDAPDPSAGWERVAALAEHTAVTDIRWTLITRWRSLTAHFFDSPGVCRDLACFDSLDIRGADRHTARLFAAWLRSSVRWPNGLNVRIDDVTKGAPLESIRLAGGGRALTLTLAPSRACINSSADLAHNAAASTVVALGDQRLPALLGEELRIRSRDAAFERAVLVARESP